MIRKLILIRQKQIYAFVLVTIVLFILSQRFNVLIYSVYKDSVRSYSTSLDIQSWIKDRQSTCDGNFISYGHQFAVLKNVIIPSYSESFYLPCKQFSLKHYQFQYGKEGTHMNSWIKNVHPYKKNVKLSPISIEKMKVLVAVKRYEYLNVYHTMTDWYNVFLVSTLLNIPSDTIDILLYDNSTGYLDNTWDKLFGRVIRINNVTGTQSITAEILVWNILGYESPLNYHSTPEVPYIENFRKFFITKYGISDKDKLNCNSVSISFLLRRDYVNHARIKSVSRKIANEKELYNVLKKHYPSAIINVYSFENYSIHYQLNAITKTDILISMHGAGLSHILFLPSHAGVIELFPLYWVKFPGMIHFEAFARWRHLKYSSWQNLNPNNEVDKYLTYIPPTVILQHVEKVYTQICPH
ncbi:hypothetical protein ACF0H5_018371 [Mactra antiquata]